MSHIILVKDIQELSSPAIQAVAARLRQIGVQVHFVAGSTLTGDLRKTFTVESHGKIAWEMHVHEGHVEFGLVTTNKHLADNYRRVFEKLHGNEIHI